LSTSIVVRYNRRDTATRRSNAYICILHKIIIMHQAYSPVNPGTRVVEQEA
jgi:hypothetical protein